MFVMYKKLEGHTNLINNIILMPNDLIVSLSLDNTIRVWDSITGKCIKNIINTAKILCIDIFNENTIICGYMNGNIKLLNIETDEYIIYNTLHTGSIICIILFDNNKIISGGNDSTINICDISSNKYVIKEPLNQKILEGHTSLIRCIKQLSTNKLISASYDRTVRIWNIHTTICIQRLTTTVDFIRCIEPLNEEIIIAGGRDGILLWNIKDNINWNITDNHKSEKLFCLELINKKYVVFGCWNNSVYIKEIETGKYSQELKGHTKFVNCMAISPTNNKIISGSNDKTIIIWENITEPYDYSKLRMKHTNEQTKKIKEELLSYTWHPDRVMDWCMDEEIKKGITQIFK